MAAKKTASKKGISAKSFSGLSKQRMQSNRSANFGKRLMLQQGDTIPVQFLDAPGDMLEFEVHSWRDGNWNFVPCLGENCPLCDDESTDRRKKSYRFVANVYNLKDKKVQYLEGPKDLASRISYRFERKPSMFLKRTFEITKFKTQPVTYDVQVGEDSPVKTTNLEKMSLQDYIDEEARRFYGDELPVGKSSLDADDEEDEDVTEDVEDDDSDAPDEEELREELEELNLKALKARAKSNGAALSEYKGLELDELIDFIVTQEIGDEDDEDEEDEEDLDTEDEDLDDEDEDDDDEDEDEEDEDEEPAAKRAPARKSAAKKSPAKKAASRRR